MRAKNLEAAGQAEAAFSQYAELAAAGGAEALPAARELARLQEQRGETARAFSRYLELCGAESEPEFLARAGRKAAQLAPGAGGLDAAARCLSEAAGKLGVRDDLRQGLLADLGELKLLAGDAPGAVEVLRKAQSYGQGEEGLRASLALGRAQEKAGKGDAALETYLRIGYLYDLRKPGAAEAGLRAAELLKAAGRTGDARALLKKIAAGAPEPWAGEAAGKLDPSMKWKQ